MVVKPDHWIRRYGAGAQDDEPFTAARCAKASSAMEFVYGYDIASPMNFAFSRTSIRPSWIPNILMRARSSSTRRCLHRSAEFLCARPFGRIFSHSSQRPDDLPRQVHVRGCGIIVNVTPFETRMKALSRSKSGNTTPLLRKFTRTKASAASSFCFG